MSRLGQLSDVHRNAPRLVLGHELGSRTPAGLLLVIDIRERLPVGVPHGEAGMRLLDGPGRREAALRHALTISMPLGGGGSSRHDLTGAPIEGLLNGRCPGTSTAPAVPHFISADYHAR